VEAQNYKKKYLVRRIQEQEAEEEIFYYDDKRGETAKQQLADSRGVRQAKVPKA